MTTDNELTSRQLLALFVDKYPVSISTLMRALQGGYRKKIGYCALIREENKEKRLLWCKERIEQNDLDQSDVIFSDESSVQLESHRNTTKLASHHAFVLGQSTQLRSMFGQRFLHVVRRK